MWIRRRVAESRDKRHDGRPFEESVKARVTNSEVWRHGAPSPRAAARRKGRGLAPGRGFQRKSDVRSAMIEDEPERWLTRS